MMKNKSKILITAILIFICYFASIYLGLKLSIPGSTASPLWPAAGLGAFILLHFGKLSLIPLFISGVLADFQGGSSLGVSTFIILSAVIEISIFNVFYKKLKIKTITWEQYSEVFSLLLSATAACLFGALFGNLTLIYFNIIPFAFFNMSYLVWFIGDALGIIFFFPLLQEIKNSKYVINDLFKIRTLLSITELGLHAVVAYLIFTNPTMFPWIFIIFLLVFLSFYLHNYQMALLAAFTYYFVGLMTAAFFHKGFISSNMTDNILMIQLFFCSLFISVIFFSIFVHKKSIRTIIFLMSTGWIVSTVALYIFIKDKENQYQKDFIHSVETTTSDLQDRVKIYEALIKANAGIIKSRPSISRNEWKIYSEHLSLTTQYPGINGIGFVTRITADQISQLETTENKSSAVPFKIHPMPQQTLSKSGVVGIIKFIQPYENNKAALGLELTSETKRKEAIFIAEEINSPTITDQIVLVQDLKKGSGFLYYYPITDDQFKKLGWAYAPFISDVFFKSVISPEILKNYDYKVTYLGYQGDLQTLKEFETENSSGLNTTTILNIANKKMVIQWKERQNLFNPFQLSTALLILVLQLFWLLITSLVAGFLFINSKVQTLADAYKNELEKNQLILVQTSKMSALGEMASGIAHEINNPLSVINGRAEILERLITQPELDKIKFFESLEKIKTTVQRIKKIINGLRTFSRSADKDPFTALPIKNIVDSTLELCQEKFKSQGVNLEVDLIPINHQVFGNEIQLSQVLLNLLNNSYDAIQSNENPWVKITFDDSGEVYIIRITDSGSGIPKHVAEKIMEPFFTTKEVGKGTGLGLSISRGIIQDHHGKFYLDSNAKNTTFVIELPKYKN